MKLSKNFKKGDVIIREHDSGDEAYYVIKGSVEVRKEFNGKEIFLRSFSTGEIFGEMAVIDESPRSASVIALEDTEVRIIHRDHLLKVIQTDHDMSVKILKKMFERLRDANLKLSKIDYQKDTFEAKANEESEKNKQAASLVIRGLTSISKMALDSNPLVINQFPVRIGRDCVDPLVDNDIYIQDEQPYQISRTHLKVSLKDNKLVFQDRGSKLGVIINEEEYGKAYGNPLPSEPLEEAEVIFGKQDSPYVFNFSLDFNT